MHPFIANYSDEFKSKLPIEFIAITEVLTEAHMYEICIPEESIHAIMKRRDKILRELVFGDRASAPLVAGMVKDALSDSTGLEDAIYKAFHTLGFETTKIGGSNNPDGYAVLFLDFLRKINQKIIVLLTMLKVQVKIKFKQERLDYLHYIDIKKLIKPNILWLWQ